MISHLKALTKIYQMVTLSKFLKQQLNCDNFAQPVAHGFCADIMS